MMRSKLIKHSKNTEFERELDEFLEDLNSYSVQYKPIADASGYVMYTALIMYYVEEDEDGI
jgi:hypothetical protein